MFSEQTDTSESLRRRLEQSDGTVRIGEFVAEHSVTEPELLAELIEIYGRKRIALGRPVSLEDYLTEIPFLADSDVALDAAIDMCLRSLSGSSRPDPVAVDRLINRHPEFTHQIETAYALGHALWATEHATATPTEYRTNLPADFGPNLQDGHPRYTLERLLGSGAFGEVYLTRDNLLSDVDKPAHVAIKIFSSAITGRDATRRFIDEATKARRVDHRNVARVLDRGTTSDDREYIVYEHVNGSSLDALRRSAPKPMHPREAAALIARAARGVQAIHMSGLTHCDLKPGNIVVSVAGEPKIVDLGVATRSSHNESRPLGYLAMRPIGSLAFMSPEQFRMEDGAQSPPCDVYALGGILYWLLTDQLPNGDTPTEIEQRLGKPNDTPARQYARAHGHVATGLRLIVERALAPNPLHRHDSASSLADDLERWLRSEPIRWQNPSRFTIAALAARRRPLTAAMFALLLLSLAGTAALAASYRQEVHTALEQVEFESRLRHSTGPYLDAMARIRKELNGSDFLGKQLYILDLTIMACGRGFLDNYDAVLALTRERVQTLNDRIIEIRHNFGYTTIEALIIQTALGMTHVHERNHAAAIPVLEENVELWKATIPSHDPQIACAIILLESARADRLLDQIGAGPPTQSDLDEARAIASRLFEALDRFVGTATGGPVRIQGYRRLEALYGPALLDDHTRYEQAYAIAHVDEALMRK